MSQEKITINFEEYLELVSLYREGREKGAAIVTFKGREFDIDYLKYLLQHLEGRFSSDDS